MPLSLWKLVTLDGKVIQGSAYKDQLYFYTLGKNNLK